MVVQDKGPEVREIFTYAKPLTFDEFLETFGPKDFVELVDGVVVEKTMVNMEHERLQKWLLHVLDLFAKRSKLGEVFGSRSAVKISEFRGRMPDLFFVARERMDIVTLKSTLGPPDMTIEIVSPGDRPSDRVALEVDYMTIGVKEIVFIDQKRRRVRVLRLREEGYEESVVRDGSLTLETVGGIELELNWLFDEPRPDELEILDRWLAARG